MWVKPGSSFGGAARPLPLNADIGPEGQSVGRCAILLRPTRAIPRDNAGLADPKIKARLADLGGTVLPGSPADFGKLIADETEKWAKVIQFGQHQAGVNGASGRTFHNVPFREWRL